MTFTTFAFPLLAGASLASGAVAAPLALRGLGMALLLCLIGGAVAFFARERLQRNRRTQPRLRLVHTANAWGYSDRATLDESAVGL